MPPPRCCRGGRPPRSAAGCRQCPRRSTSSPDCRPRPPCTRRPAAPKDDPVGATPPGRVSTTGEGPGRSALRVGADARLLQPPVEAHDFAVCRSRLAVVREMPITSAASSTLSPPRKRSSTRRAWLSSKTASSPSAVSRSSRSGSAAVAHGFGRGRSRGAGRCWPPPGRPRCRRSLAAALRLRPSEPDAARMCKIVR